MLVPLKYLLDAFILLNSNFLHATIAILHDIQSLGWTYQSLTIYRIARYFLNVGRCCSLVDTCRIVFYYVLKVTPYVCKEIVLFCALWYVQSTILFIYIIKHVTTHFWYYVWIYINRS